MIGRIVTYVTKTGLEETGIIIARNGVFSDIRLLAIPGDKIVRNVPACCP